MFHPQIQDHFPILAGIPILVMTAASVGEYPKKFSPEFIVKKTIEIDDLFLKVENALMSNSGKSLLHP